jgi:hypothetical protein
MTDQETMMPPPLPVPATTSNPSSWYVVYVRSAALLSLSFLFTPNACLQDVQSQSLLDDVADFNSSPFQVVAGMFGSDKKPNLDFTLGRI